MDRWSIMPNAARGNSAPAEGYRVGATFDSPSDEHYYGLGQDQEGFLDMRGHRMNCWHDYGAPGGQTVCVPFVVSSRGYGLVWNNASKSTVDFGINGLNKVEVFSGANGDFTLFSDDGTSYSYENRRLSYETALG